MKTEKLILNTNFEEIMDAQKLGIPIPKGNRAMKSKMLFYRKDVRRVVVDAEGDLMIEMYDGEIFTTEYDEKTWKGLEEFFENDDLLYKRSTGYDNEDEL